MKKLFYFLFLFLFCLYFYLQYYHSSPPTYLYWTGGYDSTFRLCFLVIIQQTPVQPIYLSSVIDNQPSLSVRRHNHSQELQAMQHILEVLRQRYPSLAHLILPLQIVSKEIPYTPDVKKHMVTLSEQGLLRRPVCQYGALAQYALNLQKPIEICVEKDPIHSAMYKTVSHQVDTNGRLPLLPRSNPLSIFQMLCFSTIQYTKQDMLRIAKQHQFDDILSLSWSCWYPSKDGKPCGRCIMCSDRII